MTDDPTCPHCGAALPADSPKGLCPRCLLKNVMDGAAAAADVVPGFTTTQPGSVLDTLSAAVGPLPHVLLPDPGSEMSVLSDRSGRYQLFGEIGRGGMGAILRGRDPDLGRELAVKVLLEGHKDKPDLVRRFVEEAQIGGQLQHPGIVPVYEFGAFSDARPYFTMKLVKGRTLAALLGDRKEPTDDRPRFLSIFEAIAQTVAYAHARGVIHRDLKPSNVMVGSFGEVQVMDWGLAKVLRQEGSTEEEGEQPEPESVSVIRTVRSGSDADASRAGSVLGTPAYMAPEQAAGDIHLVDERADVFGLGAILCEVLTGAPPYNGWTQAEVLRNATRGDTADACVRLDACGADADLIALTKGCLARDPLDRPGDAGEVARRITAYLAGVQEKLHTAERERAVAEARAVEESKRRRVTLALAASVLALVVFGGGGGAWYTRHRERQAAQVVLLTREAHLLRSQARAQADDPARWLAAREAVKRVEVALGDSPDLAARKTLEGLRAEVESGLSGAEADRTLLERLVDIRSASAEDSDGLATDAAYAAAFGSAGIDVDALPPSEVGARIARRPGSVARDLVAALDHWTSVRKDRGANGSDWTKLVAAARAADPDPDRDALRAALLVGDRAGRMDRLRPLAGRAGVESWAPSSLVLLAQVLAGAGDVDAAVAILRRGSGTHPGDAWVYYELGQLLEQVRPPQPEGAIAAYMAARAVRPETAHVLAHALANRGRGEEAEAIFRDLTLRRPGNARHLTCFGKHLKYRGRGVEATAVLDRAIAAGHAVIRLNPNNAEAHFNLSNALSAQGKLDEAITECRAAIRLDPGHAEAYNNLSNALSAQGKLVEAVTELRRAIRLNPDHAKAHTNLGAALNAQGKREEAIAEYRTAIRLNPDLVEARNNLGLTLSHQGKAEEAIAEYKTAIRLKPDLVEARYNLGLTLSDQGKAEEAIAEYKTAIRLKPDHAEAHCNLGNILSAQGKAKEAIDEYRTAIRLNPDLAQARYCLGHALSTQGKAEEAIAEYKTAIRLKPDHAEAHCNLGLLLLGKNRDYAEALALLRRGRALGSKRANWRYPSAEWVRQAERSVALDAKLPTILTGNTRPDDAPEGLVLGQMCTTRGLYGAATRLYVDAFAADPRLVDDLKAGHRYRAARAAALAGSGRGKDEPPPDAAAQAELRRQAREWLKADLAAQAGRFDSGTEAVREGVRKALSSWKSNSDLAGVRSPEALEKLPEEEQEAWRSLWSEVDARLKQAGGHLP